MKPVRTWILIADGARARIVLNDGPGHGVKALPGHVFESEVPAGREIMADRQGRSFESSGDGRHAMEPPSDPRRLKKQSFAGELAVHLHEACLRKEFDRLIVVAPAVTLGDLRKAMTDPVRKVLTAELSKDLTHLPNGDLPKHLESVLAV